MRYQFAGAIGLELNTVRRAALEHAKRIFVPILQYET